jgi:hypothetical protein
MGDLHDEIIFRCISPGKYTIEFSYEASFIEYLKKRVPAHERSYDPDTQLWTFNDDSFRLNALEGIAVQKFRHAQRIYWNNEGKLVMRNIKTGAEAIQESLF